MLLPLTTDQQQWLESTLNAMTLPQAIGQLLCPSNPRFTAADWAALLKQVHLGSIRMGGRPTTAALRESMQPLQEQSAIPILVAGDLEHGAIELRDGTEFPWMMAAGAANDVDLMRLMGQASAAEARYAGVHWSFSPVVDLNYNFQNPITNVRAMGDQPERVKRLAVAYVQGLQAGGADGRHGQTFSRRWHG